MSKQGYDHLMHVVCVEWGFCGCVKHDQRLHVDQLIPSEGLVTADQFVEWVFLADDMNPNSDPGQWNRHKAAIRAAFIQHMGGEVVDASRLRWSDVPEQPKGADEKFRGRLI
jgi:hypothetical protein